VANEGLDNSEGNLIVFENDVIIVPKQSLHTISEQTVRNPGKITEFRIQSCLGQGTFAQVFQCLHIQSGKIVAIKIVKNKPAYTRQATVEIDVFRSLQEEKVKREYMVSLDYFFMHNNHLCLVFEKLSLNLYEVLKKRQFRGLPLDIVQQLISQAVIGMKDLTQKNIVHCDLKPENILLVSDEVSHEVVNAEEMTTRSRDADRPQEPQSTATAASTTDTDLSTSTTTAQNTCVEHSSKRRHLSPHARQHKIKVIDFGSACFEGYTAHTYIQSRFYRSPEVLIGLPYDSGIDMWSLGCVAAELFLGLPILPGCHEHDQLGRIQEMIAQIPDWMLDQGSKATKYYIKFRPNVTPSSETSSPMLVGTSRTPSPRTPVHSASPSTAPPLPQWRIKTQPEFIQSLSQNEVRKKGGLAKLEKQPGSRYFKREKLADILTLHAQSNSHENKELLPAFIHFLYSVLDPDPWKRLTAFQAAQHPFVTGKLSDLTLNERTPDLVAIDTKDENQANLLLRTYWQAPWDPAICRRKLLNVQRQRERQQTMRRNLSQRSQHSSSIGGAVGGESALDPRRPRSGMYTPMAESPIDQQHTMMYPRRQSPPIRLYPSSSSQVGRTSTDEFDRGAPLSSSLSGLHRQGAAADLAFGADLGVSAAVFQNSAMPPPPGPQSFGMHDDFRRGPAIAGDFALALQRPGVVPGSGPSYLGSSYYDSSTAGSMPQSMTERTRFVPQSRAHDEQALAYVRSSQVSGPMSHSQLLTPQSSIPSMMSTVGSNRVSSSISSNLSVQDGALHGQHAHNHGISFADQAVYQQGQPFPSQQQQQQQQRQQEQHQHHQQPHVLTQQIWMTQQQQQASQTHFQQLSAKQQQPIYLANDPMGGVYFVATSSNGQPVFLQPMGQEGMYNPNMQNSNIPVASQLGATGIQSDRWAQPASVASNQQMMYQDSFMMQPPSAHQTMQYPIQVSHLPGEIRQQTQTMMSPQSTTNHPMMQNIAHQQPNYPQHQQQQQVFATPLQQSQKSRSNQTRRRHSRGTSM
jgi:serine/threonine protein kinase